MQENSPSSLEYQVYDPERREFQVMVVEPPKRRYWLHALLFALTIFSTLCIGARLQYDFSQNVWPYLDDEYLLPWSWALQDWHRLIGGIPFCAYDAAFTLLCLFLFRRLLLLGLSGRLFASSLPSGTAGIFLISA